MVYKVFRNYKAMLIIAAVCGILAAVVAANEWKKITGTKDVLVAAVEIQPGKELTSKEVAIEPKNEKDLPSDKISDLTELEGKAPRGVIPLGTVLRQSMFQPIEQFGAEGMLREHPGRKAVAFQMDIETTVGGQIKQGSAVDIHAIIASAAGEKKSVVAEKAPILVISLPSAENKNSGAVIVALTPQEIDMLVRTSAESAKYKFVLLPRD
ncbi:MAG: SAF domain-containing protein [Bacillota bacterium]